MFVELWMEGIDDGKNRVGGDPLLMIFSAMRKHGFEIPFAQREVRVRNPGIAFGQGIGMNMANLPHAHSELGRELRIQYFADVYPVKVEVVGYTSLHDPENVKPRS